jgi:trk/ktr system potassium uptake protein
MYIIVVGGGQLGYHLTKALLSESHEVLLLERDAKTSQSLINELGSVAVRGDGCEASVLAKAGTSRADMLVAVTGDDEDNLVACQVAKHKFAVPRTIARVRNPRNESLFRKLGVDVTVSSTSLILEHIEHEMPSHPLMHLMIMHDRGLEIVEVTVPAESASIGRAIGDLNLPSDTTISLIIHKGQKPFVPDKQTIILAEDRILAIAPPEAEEALRGALAGESPAK